MYNSTEHQTNKRHDVRVSVQPAMPWLLVHAVVYFVSYLKHICVICEPPSNFTGTRSCQSKWPLPLYNKHLPDRQVKSKAKRYPLTVCRMFYSGDIGSQNVYKTYGRNKNNHNPFFTQAFYDGIFSQFWITPYDRRE